MNTIRDRLRSVRRKFRGLRERVFVSNPKPFTLVFPHIAKTGGTTLLHHFRRNLGGKKVFIYGPYSQVTRFFNDLPQLEEMPRHDIAALRVMQGHGVSEDVIPILPDARIRLLIVLRHPVSLTRSRFNHRRDELARLGVDLDSEQFLSATPRNPISTMLLNQFPSFIDSAAVAPYDQVVSILRKFDYVFTTETLDLQATELMRELNLPAVMERRRVARESGRLDATDEQLKQNNTLDLKIYEAAAKGISLDPRRNPFRLDRDGKDAVIQQLRRHASSAEDAIQRAYRHLAKCLCTYLKAEEALKKIENPPVALNDRALFGDILRSEWSRYQEGLNTEQNDQWFVSRVVNSVY